MTAPGAVSAPRQPGILRFSAAQFLASLILLIVVAPFLEMIPDGDLIESGLLTLVLVTAVLAVGGRRKALACAIILVAPALIGKWVNHWWPDLIPPRFFIPPAMLFVGFVVQQLLRFILRAPRIGSEVLCAGVAGYLLLGLFWAVAYITVARWTPDAFVWTAGPSTAHDMRGFTALYFSLITLSTVGYGDIVPVTGPARMLAATEAVVGTMYLALLVARLVSLYSSAKPDNRGSH